jgi:hypothetical protein
MKYVAFILTYFSLFGVAFAIAVFHHDPPTRTPLGQAVQNAAHSTISCAELNKAFK